MGCIHWPAGSGPFATITTGRNAFDLGYNSTAGHSCGVTEARNLASDQVGELFGPPNGQRSLLVVGAGSSSPAAPLAWHLKAGILSAVSAVLGKAVGKIPQEQFFTLELVCSLLQARFDEAIDLKRFFTSILSCSQVPKAALVIAELIRQRRVRCVLTANFDDYLYRALDLLAVPHRVITRAAFRGDGSPEPLPGDVFAFHGSVLAPEGRSLSPPTSIEARGLATPFTQAMLDYLQIALADVETIIFWGYSGSDHFDLSPAIETCLSRNTSVTRIIWLSYDGGEGGFSEYVRDKDCSFGILSPLAEVVNGQKRIPEIVAEGLIERDSTSAVALGVDDLAKIKDDEIVERIASTFRRFLSSDATVIRAAASDFYADVFESKIWVPWVLIEHYYLDSLSNTENVQRAFLGVGGSKKTFLEIDVTSLAETVLAYWKVNRSAEPVLEDGGHLLSSPAGGDSEKLIERSKFRSAHEALKTVAASIDVALARSSTGRRIDRAFLMVCRALTENYIGLIRLRVLEQIVALGLSDAASERSVREEVQATFQAAMDLATQAGTLETKARVSQSSPRSPRSLTSANLWHRVALFNLGRATIGMEGIRTMRRSIDELLEIARGAGNDFERAACYLQAAHQASIVAKALYGIKGNEDRPLAVEQVLAVFSASDPDISLVEIQQERQRALNNCRECEKQFRDLTGRFDSRLLAVADVLVIQCLSNGDHNGAREIAQKYQMDYAFLPNPQYPNWLPNILKRIDGMSGGSTTN